MANYYNNQIIIDADINTGAEIIAFLDKLTFRNDITVQSKMFGIFVEITTRHDTAIDFISELSKKFPSACIINRWSGENFDIGFYIVLDQEMIYDRFEDYSQNEKVWGTESNN